MLAVHWTKIEHTAGFLLPILDCHKKLKNDTYFGGRSEKGVQALQFKYLPLLHGRFKMKNDEFKVLDHRDHKSQLGATYYITSTRIINITNTYCNLTNNGKDTTQGEVEGSEKEINGIQETKTTKDWRLFSLESSQTNSEINSTPPKQSSWQHHQFPTRYSNAQLSI